MPHVQKSFGRAFHQGIDHDAQGYGHEKYAIMFVEGMDKKK